MIRDMEYMGWIIFHMSISIGYLRWISMFYVSLVLNIQLWGVKWKYIDSVSVLLVSACLLLIPSDKTCTSLLLARADLTLIGNPSTEEELTKAEFFLLCDLGGLRTCKIENLETGQVPNKYSAGCSLHSDVTTQGI